MTILFDHILFEGASACYFHRDLIRELSKQPPDMEFQSIIHQQNSLNPGLPINQEVENMD